MNNILFLVQDYNDRGDNLLTSDLDTARQFLAQGKPVFTGTAGTLNGSQPIVLGGWRRLFALPHPSHPHLIVIGK